jgi:biopolymer transport protein ExbD
MIADIEKYEQIERFLTNRLSEEERIALEISAVSDAQLAGAIERHRQVVHFVNTSMYLGIREKIGEIHTKRSRKAKIRKSGIKTVTLIAVVLIILSAILFFMLNNNRQKSTVKPQLPPASHEEQPIQNKGVSSSIPKPPNNTLQNVRAGSACNPDSLSKIQSTENHGEEKQLIRQNTLQLNPIRQEESTIDISHILTKTEHPEQPQEQITQQNILQENSFDCSQVSIFAEVTLEPSCENEATGTIAVAKTTISGGTPPYSLSIDNQKSYQTKLKYSALSPNHYSVWIRDDNECSTCLGTFTVGNVRCGYQDIFAPDKGELWEIPNKGMACKMLIYNQNGALVVEADYDLPGSYFWDGRNALGEIQPMGVYTFLLRFEDSTSLQGNVTIIR